MSTVNLTHDDALKVKRLIMSIEDMTNELKKVLLTDNVCEEVKKHHTKKVNEKLFIGAHVMIKNTHGGYYGKKGKIVTMSRFFCHIQIDGGNLILKRAKKNVKLLND